MHDYDKLLRAAMMTAHRYARGGYADRGFVEGETIYDPMGNVIVGSGSEDTSSPLYKAIEAASSGFGKAGAAVGEPLRRGVENYLGNVGQAFHESGEYAKQGLENTVSDKGPLYNTSGPLQYALGSMGQVFSPLTGAAMSAGQAATQLTGNPDIGKRVEFVGGMMDPSHVGMLKSAAAIPMAARTAAKAEEAAQALALAKKMAQPRQTMAAVPNIRELPVADAVDIVRQEPHLIRTESGYVGAPAWVKTPEDLAAMRKYLDDYIAADPRGGDWYDRYRAGVTEVTGGDKTANKWMTSQHGQWSAGVSPEGELGFTVKENNGALAGMPVKSARPAQHEAHMAAIEANDPSKYQLGKKTGEYASKVSPDQIRPAGATGVNDFRHARNFGYTEANGEPQRNAMTATQHTFMDYETALAVDRANQNKVGGRSDWTGESLQAAPWVRQKALDILGQRPNIMAEATRPEKIDTYMQNAYRSGVNDPDRAMQIAMDAAKADAYETAFQLANKTIADYFPKHTAFGTHEAQPGAFTGHLPKSVGAPEAERNAYAMDPRSSWANAPGNRDAIYGGLSIGDTGTAMRVRPTIEMQGMYTPDGGATEFNKGATARPLVGFDSGKSKTVSPGDQALLNAGEGVRAYIDAQQGGAWHKPWTGGAPGEARSYTIPMDRSATPEELMRLRDAMSPHGLGDVVDTGQGLTVTSFYPGPPTLKGKARNAADEAIAASLPKDAQGMMRAKVDSNYLGYDKEWQAGVGSGEATRTMLDLVNKTPEIRAAFNKNPYIPQNALDRMARDTDWQSTWGATREDIQNARRIIGKGPGWIDRLEKGLKNGALLPAVGAAILGPLVASSPDE